MQTMAEIEDEIIDEFEQFDDPMDLYEYIIDQGKMLPELDTKFRTDDFIVKGCQSKVWLHAFLNGGNMMMQVDSNTAITKGIAALLLRVLNQRPPAEILNAKLDFIDRTGLRSLLSSQRSNGLSAMINRIRQYAAAFAG